MSGSGIGLAAVVVVLVGVAPGTVAQGEGEGASLRAEVEPLRGTVGDPLALRLTLELPAGAELVSETVGPELGPFTVLSGRWEEPGAGARGGTRTWNGLVAAYETGELELPPVQLELRLGAKTASVRSTPVAIRIESVLADDETPEPAGIKDPVSLPADFGALRLAVTVLLALLVLSLAVWWLVRRYAPRLAARPVAGDAFERMPPHEWVYAALRELLERRLAEQGRVAEFYSELARIVKRYLGGRYRVDLMERTTAEVPAMLRQAGAPEDALRDALALLGRSDRVKFARQLPDDPQCRREIDEAYGIVDRTRPVETTPAPARAGTA